MSRSLGAVLAVSLLLKVSLAVVHSDITLRYDEEEFLAFARTIAAGGEPVLWRAPGYQSFLAWSLALDGGSTLAARVLQAILSVVTTWLVWRAGCRAFGERTALLAATFVAFYPSHVAFSHLLWAETLFLPFVVLSFERALAAEEPRRGLGAGLAAATAGISLGIAALVRSTALLLIAATAVWFLTRRVRRFTLTVPFVVAAAIVIAPWSLVASRRAGRLVLVDTNSGFNLWSGNNEYIPHDLQGIWSVGLPPANGTEEGWSRLLRARGLPPALAQLHAESAWRGDFVRRLAEAGIPDPLGPEAEEWFRQEARREITRDPLGFVARIPRHLAAFWSPDFFLPRHLLRDWYGPTPPSLAAGLVVLTWVGAAVPLLAGPFALLSLRRSPFRSLALAWIVITLAAHGVTYGHSRMHQPLVPFLVLAACAFLARDFRVRPGFGATAAGVAALAGWISVAPVVVGLYIAPGPRHVETAAVLGAVRHLPLPGTRWAAWGTASAQAAAGHPEIADRILAEEKHASEPWSLWLRALLAENRASRLERLDALLARDPTFEPAKRLREAVAHRGAP